MLFGVLRFDTLALEGMRSRTLGSNGMSLDVASRSY